MRLGAVRLIILTMVSAMSTACGGARTVALEFSGVGEDAAVAGAIVSATPMRAGAVPLPLEDDTLQELTTTGNLRLTRTTDANGRVRLRVLSGRPHEVQFAAPPFSALASDGPWVWWLEADGETIRPLDEAAPVRARIVR